MIGCQFQLLPVCPMLSRQCLESRRRPFNSTLLPKFCSLFVYIATKWMVYDIRFGIIKSWIGVLGIAVSGLSFLSFLGRLVGGIKFGITVWSRRFRAVVFEMSLWWEWVVQRLQGVFAILGNNLSVNNVKVKLIYEVVSERHVWVTCMNWLTWSALH